jgi:hypothetical protein
MSLPITPVTVRPFVDDRSLLLLTAVAALATIPGAVVERTASVPLHPLPTVHFGLVAGAALAAAIASVALSSAGARLGDGRTVLLASTR